MNVNTDKTAKRQFIRHISHENERIEDYYFLQFCDFIYDWQLVNITFLQT